MSSKKASLFSNHQIRQITENETSSAGELLPQLICLGQHDKLNRVVEALLPEIAPSRTALVLARMQADAKTRVLESRDYVRSADIATMAGYSENNPSAQPRKWKREGLIFTIKHNGIDYFPAFGLDPEKNYKPYPALAAVLKVFAGTRSGWKMAYWFAGLNSFLDDKRPQDLLADKPDQVIAAARDAMEGLQHG